MKLDGLLVLRIATVPHYDIGNIWALYNDGNWRFIQWEHTALLQ